jgi:hypothetical protein
MPLAICILALPICGLLIYPCAEIGIVDDPGYIRSAQVLANTGHFVFNGSTTAILGWQLYMGAAMIKLFGFSFTAVRLGTLFVAVASAALMHRLLIRLGINSLNALAITLTFILCPEWLCLTFSFMSDVYGVFALLVCCYCCVRAIQTPDSRRSAYWICAAVVLDVIGGTARQIAWLGVLAMVPCALWILRRRRIVLIAGLPCVAAGAATVYFLLGWFKRQPYSLPFPLLCPPGDAAHVINSLNNIFTAGGFEIVFLCLPFLLLFLPVVFRRDRRSMTAVLIWLVYVVLRLGYLHKMRAVGMWEVPYMYNLFWYWGMDYFPTFLGHAPVLITVGVQKGFLLLLLIGEAGLIAALFSRRGTVESAATGDRDFPGGLSGWRTLSLLFLPTTIVYLLLLLPRWIQMGGSVARYLLFPEFVLLLFLGFLYQQRVRTQVPWMAWVCIGAISGFYVIGLHDAFAFLRAQANLLQRVTESGVPRQQVDGGYQYNTWTEILTSGYLNDPRIQVPSGAYVPVSVPDNICHTGYRSISELTPSVRPHYVVSFDPTLCGGPSQFGPYVFHTWFQPRDRTLYIVKVAVTP